MLPKASKVPQRGRLVLLIATTFLAVAAVFFLPPIPQGEHYHRFADQRALWGIPNFANVLSNLPLPSQILFHHSVACLFLSTLIFYKKLLLLY